MLVSSMYDLPAVMAELTYTDEQVFDLGISGELVFLVVVPELGACRVPDVALSHFMAGADSFAADRMPEHYTGALSGPWTVKRDRLRILPESVEGWLTQCEPFIKHLQAQNTPPAQTPAPLVTVEPASDAPAKRRTWRDVSLPFMREVFESGQFATAKAFYRALENKAGSESPFERGTGENRGNLFVRETATNVKFKTIQNTVWKALKKG